MNQLKEFDAYVEQLKKHDWTYEFTEDQVVWSQGRAAHLTLVAQAKKSPQNKEAYYVFFKHVFGKEIDHGANKAICDAAIEALRHQIKVEMIEALINPQPTTV